MKSRKPHALHLFRGISTMLICAALTLSLAARSQAQEKVIHYFTGPDGAGPFGDLILDASGNLYGVTSQGGHMDNGDCILGCGTVFRLSRGSGGWKITTLHQFTGGKNGSSPSGELVADGDGNLYGAASDDVDSSGFVYRLSPTSSGWKYTVLYAFPAGGGPSGKLALDPVGNLYGVSRAGNLVFELSSTGGTWKETVLYTFTGGADGSSPIGGLTLDSSGNLYGVTLEGGNTNSVCTFVLSGCGVVFELSPNSSGGWTETVLHTFSGGTDGDEPAGPVTVDSLGNVYGTTLQGGSSSGCATQVAAGCGVVFELSSTGGKWKETVLHIFQPATDGTDGGYKGGFPQNHLTLDSDGNLYTATAAGGRVGVYQGVALKLSHISTGWAETVLDAFYGKTDGGSPASSLTLDGSGNVFGTTLIGGNRTCGMGCGVVYEIVLAK